MKLAVEACYEIRDSLGQHPGVARLANGDLLLTYGDFTDQMQGQTGYVLRSRDQGRTWSEPELMLKPRWWRGGTHTSLGIQTLRSGRVLIPWTHGANLKKHHDSPSRFICLRSDDHGRSWQGWDEQQIPMHRICPYGKIIELPDGDLLCPAWGQKDKTSSYLGTSFVLRSRDQGETWSEPSFICKEHPSGANETDLTMLPDGRLLALIRVSGAVDVAGTASHRDQDSCNGPRLFWVHASWSEDGGRTWTPLRSVNVLAQNFNAWPVSGGRLIGACRGIDGSGHLRQEDIRPNAPRLTAQSGFGIQVFSSADSGQTWDYLLTLPDPGGREYSAWHEAGEPAFCNLDEGRILIVYYSYRESIINTLEVMNDLNPFVRSEMLRIPHAFRRRICGSILFQS